MTKTVRVENADTGRDFALVVQTWVKGYGEASDHMMSELELLNPTDLRDFLIHRDQFLVVKEKSI